jgi:hypothetical protein
LVLEALLALVVLLFLVVFFSAMICSGNDWL